MAFSVNQVAWVLGISVNSVWNLVADESLPSFSIGRRRLIAKSAVEAFVANGGTARNEP